MNNEIKALATMEQELDNLTLYAKTLYDRSDKSKLKQLSDLRNIPLHILEDAGIFWVENQTELLLPGFVNQLKDFGVISPANNKPIFHHRWVFPIRNTDGKVINFVGYSNLVDERYVYGTGKYYNRSDVLYGLENYDEAIRLGYAIITEGITDTLAVRGLGYKNVFAWCGTMESKEKIKLLNRCRYGIIRIPDRDAPGEKTKNLWLFNRYFTLTTYFGFKDSAQMLEQGEEMQEYYKSCLDKSIEWILKKEHKGQKCTCSEGSM